MTHDRSALDALAQLTRQRGVSRRGFLRGASLSARALSGGPLLAACGVEGASKAEGSCVSNDLSRTEKQLHFSTWPLYIDQAKVKRAGKKETVYPSMERFQKESGITVDYVTESTTMPSSSASCATSSPPASRQIATSFALTDYMAGRMVGLGWIQKLDRANLGNVEANLVENLRSPSWDKNRDYSVPWQSGLTGIAYNAKLTGEVRSFDELLTRSDLKGKVSLLSEMNDTMIFMLLLEGADPEDSTDDEFGAACDRLQKSNLIRAEVLGRDRVEVVVGVEGSRLGVPADRARGLDGSVWVGVRPEKVFLAHAGSETADGSNAVHAGTVTDVSFIGVSTQYLVRMPWGQELTVFEQNTGAREGFRATDLVDLHWMPAHTFLLDAAQDAHAGDETYADDLAGAGAGS